MQSRQKSQDQLFRCKYRLLSLLYVSYVLSADSEADYQICITLWINLVSVFARLVVHGSHIFVAVCFTNSITCVMAVLLCPQWSAKTVTTLFFTVHSGNDIVRKFREHYRCWNCFYTARSMVKKYAQHFIDRADSVFHSLLVFFTNVCFFVFCIVSANSYLVK